MAIDNLKHATLIEELVKCASLGYGKNTKDTWEWANFIGYTGSADKNFVQLNISKAGKKLNEQMGYDFIKQHYPLWSNNPKYSAT